MQYVLLIYTNEAAMGAASHAETDQLVAAYGAYSEAMVKAGALVSGSRLRPSDTASTVRSAESRTQVLDGPYAETKEQLGGFFIIEAPDLDAALTWAERCPAATTGGAVEVRPVWPM